MGKPPKDRKLSRLVKKLEYQDSCYRNEGEGVFGTGKTAFGLGRIPARLKDTSCCVIGIALLLMNLTKRLRSLFWLFLLFVFLPAVPVLYGTHLFPGACGVDPK